MNQEQTQAEQKATIQVLKLEIERRDKYIEKLEKTVKASNKIIDELRAYQRQIVNTIIEDYI